MLVEALSFKLALNFLEYLKKNRVVSTGIKLVFWDRVNHEFTTFTDINEMSSYFNEQYKLIDNCTLGALCSLEVFQGTSNLYDFTTQYTASNITSSYKLTTGSQYDRERNKQRSILTNRQISFINQAVNEYLSFFNEIKRIYVTGIYSTCYAIPGYFEGTSYLNNLRLALLGGPASTSPQTAEVPIIQPLITNNFVNQFSIQRNNMLTKLNQDLLIISNRILFIEDIVNGNIIINTTPINDIIDYLTANNFSMINNTYDYMLNLPIYTLNSQTLLNFQQLKTDIESEIAMLTLL